MFKNRIRERREKIGLSQTKAACLIGMATSTWSSLELGKIRPWPKAQRDIAAVLNATEKELFPNDFK